MAHCCLLLQKNRQLFLFSNVSVDVVNKYSWQTLNLLQRGSTVVVLSSCFLALKLVTLYEWGQLLFASRCSLCQDCCRFLGFFGLFWQGFLLSCCSSVQSLAGLLCMVLSSGFALCGLCVLSPGHKFGFSQAQAPQPVARLLCFGGFLFLE